MLSQVLSKSHGRQTALMSFSILVSAVAIYHQEETITLPLFVVSIPTIHFLAFSAIGIVIQYITILLDIILSFEDAHREWQLDRAENKDRKSFKDNQSDYYYGRFLEKPISKVGRIFSSNHEALEKKSRESILISQQERKKKEDNRRQKLRDRGESENTVDQHFGDKYGQHQESLENEKTAAKAHKENAESAFSGGLNSIFGFLVRVRFYYLNIGVFSLGCISALCFSIDRIFGSSKIGSVPKCFQDNEQAWGLLLGLY